MAKGSTIYKGDVSRPGLRGDTKKGYGVFTAKTFSNLTGKGPNLAGQVSIAPSPTTVGRRSPNLAGQVSIAPAPKTVGGKTAVQKPPAKLPAPTGVETVAPARVKNIPRTFVPTAKAPVKKAPTVVSNVVRERPTPTPAKAAAPARKAVSARTGDTTGVTTGKTTGTTSRVGGVATKTKQTAYGRQMASAARRGNQPTGPMGGGGRSGTGGSSRPSGGGSLGGARGRISEPGGSKR